jgi:hypothetical protein
VLQIQEISSDIEALTTHIQETMGPGMAAFHKKIKEVGLKIAEKNVKLAGQLELVQNMIKDARL